MFPKNTHELLEYYEQNKDRPWKEWLKFDKVLKKCGKQGTLGFMRARNDRDKVYVFKISKYINNLVHHESVVTESLGDIAKYCPHYVRWLGTIKCMIDPFNKDSDNPFKIHSKYPIQEEVLFTEFLDKSHKFFSYIKTTDMDEMILYSIIKQVLLAIIIAQKKKRFTHYDLHSNNIMIKKCDKDLVLLYVIDDENQYCVPTLGYYPVIIDFGFSYIEDLDDGPLFPSLGHTDSGFMSDRFDWVADPKLFLVSVSDEIKEERDTKLSHKFRRIVRNLFDPLSIDWASGWDDADDTSAAYQVLKILEPYNSKSDLFQECDEYCLDLLQSMIILPMEEEDYKDIGKNYSIFMTEWLKIENSISSSFYNMYILKGIVESASRVRAGYINNDTRIDAVSDFSKDVYKRISDVSHFCVPKGLHIEKMLCSLILLARNIEGIMYEIMEVRMGEKEREYEKLPVNCPEQIYAAIDVNIPTKYKYNENTKILVIDAINEENLYAELGKEEAKTLNNTHSLSRGVELYEIIKENV